MHVRAEVRKAVHVPVEVVSAAWDEPVEALTGDLSPAGCFVRCSRPIEPGEQVVVALRPSPAAEEISLFGTVTRAGGAEVPGFGVRFLGLGPLERLRLREHLRHVPPPLPSISRRRLSRSRLVLRLSDS